MEAINIIRDPKKKCCATCKSANLVSYGPYEPLIAECRMKPALPVARHQFVVMVANCQVCHLHVWRSRPAKIEERKKSYLTV